MTGNRYLIGVDVGGTFTDLLAYDEIKRKLLAAKVPSIPGEQWRGVLDALKELNINFEEIRAFVHGTTIATNALLERRGAKTATLSTKGFKDVLELGKGRRLTGGIFETAWRRPKPIVPRNRRHELLERTNSSGDILIKIKEKDCLDLISILKNQGAEAIAVSFINSYANPKNERLVASILRKYLHGIFVTESSALIPERGEFERSSTAVLNAYLSPVMTEYLDMLDQELIDQGVSAPFNIMGSNGGAMTLWVAAQRCASTFLSGPVGGVVGSIDIAKASELHDIITFDMGGTSTDVALVHQLIPRMSHDNQIDAFPLRMPQLDIHTIGAGGGSIIWIGPDGTVQVGPQSAGAVPGPACYGRGGLEPTISDANLLLGRLASDRPLAGGLLLDIEKAKEAFHLIASAMGADDFVAAADGVLSIAVTKMAGAVREVSVHRGFDPRDFSLISFGGAGPMHGFFVAEELGISQVIIPLLPGHLSALGQMMANLRRDLVKAWGGSLSKLSVTSLIEEATNLKQKGETLINSDGVGNERQSHEFTLDMRYCGQSFTLPIRWEPEKPDFDRLRKAFDSQHQKTFGYVDPSNDVEIVNIRLVSTGKVDKPKLEFTSDDSTKIKKSKRKVWFGMWKETEIFNRESLPTGYRFSGPAIVEESGGTSIIPQNWSVIVHSNGSLLCNYKN